MTVEIKDGWIFRDGEPVFELTEQDKKDREHFLCRDNDDFYITHVVWHKLAKLPGSICRFCEHYQGGSPKCEHRDCGGWGWWSWNGKTEQEEL